MSLSKYASFTVLSARIAQAGAPLLRTAHKASFDYEPKTGFLYVRSRAISSRCNDNFDEFPAAEIKTAYRTFVGKPVFVNHANDNHRRARGVIKDAVLHEDVNPDGSPDCWVEVLMEVDAVRFPKLAQAILAGHIDRTSMGTDVAFSVCSVCNNKASSPVEYCSHIPKLKGQRIYRRTASGGQEGILVREICYGLGFFENSLLVEEPADPTAFFLGVDARGVEGMVKAARKVATTEEAVDWVTVEGGGSGVGRAKYVTVHKAGCPIAARAAQAFPESVKMTPHQAFHYLHNFDKVCKRCTPEFEDPAWQAAHAQRPDNPRTAGKDEHRVGPWRSFEEHPDPLRIHEPGRQEQWDDPNTAYFDDIHDGLNGLKQMSDKYAEEATALAYEEGYDIGSSQRAASRQAGLQMHAPGKFPTEHEPQVRSNADGTFSSGCNCGWTGENYGSDRILAHLKSVLHTNQVAWDRGLDTGAVGTPEKPKGPKKGTSEPPRATPWEEPEWVLTAKTATTLDYYVDLACGDKVRYVGSQPGQVEPGKTWNCKTHGETTVADVSGPGTTDKGLGWDKQSSLTKQALNDIQAPKDVDTLRDEKCPVCGESDSYDGDKCQVCNFVAPPGEFTDPDLEVAKATDLRQDKDDAKDKGGDLVCTTCGAHFSSTEGAQPDPDKKQAVILDPAKDADDDATADAQDTDTAPKVGDVCPECGEGTLTQAPGADPADPAGGQDFLPAGSASKDDADDPDASDDPDDQDGKDGSKPPFVKKKPTAARSGEHHVEGEDVDMRPALAALAAQQKQIQAQAQEITNLRETVAFIADVAGIKDHPRVTAGLKVVAVDENPAFGGGWDNGAPVEGAPQAPSESTQEAATPAAKADVEAVGEGPLTDVSPDATTSLTDTGTVLDVPLDLNEKDVTAPVAGTDNLGKGERGSAGTNRIETDVRAGTPADNSAAFRDGGFLGSVGEGRVIAGLRLARLRIEASLETGDDLEIGQRLAASDITDEAMQAEIDVLSRVRQASLSSATGRQAVARNLVPQGARQAQRTTPSLTGGADAQPPVEHLAAVSAEEMAFE